MQGIRALLFFAASLASCCYGQEGLSHSKSLECVDVLHIPHYPPIARAARLSGISHVLASTDGSGSVVDVQAEGVHDILRNEIERSVRASQFSGRCGKVHVEVIFVFSIEGPPTEQSDSGSVAFRWPNQFIITVRPPVPQPVADASAHEPTHPASRPSRQ
jgi:hypothetical protein